MSNQTPTSEAQLARPPVSLYTQKSASHGLLRVVVVVVVVVATEDIGVKGRPCGQNKPPLVASDGEHSGVLSVASQIVPRWVVSW
jgi:hypothetical protein